MSRKYVVEFVGTLWLVLGGCGSAVLAAKFPEVGIGLVGVALAFGFTLLTGAYAFGHISGAHFNPAVTVGLTVAGRFGLKEVPGYIIAQVLGAIAGALILYLIASGVPQFSLTAGFAANGYGAHSPGGYSLLAGVVCEVVMTFFFLLIILGATSFQAPKGFAPLAIGIGLTLIHLISIPVTNTSVNPARSTGPALFVGDWALDQLWLFWVAPIVGAAVAGFFYAWLGTEDSVADRIRRTGKLPWSQGSLSRRRRLGSLVNASESKRREKTSGSQGEAGQSQRLLRHRCSDLLRPPATARGQQVLRHPVFGAAAEAASSLWPT